VETLRLRAGMLQAVRLFFIERGYLEIETPVLIPAPAPEAHIEAIGTSHGYLQTSPELCMKRLLAAGYPAVFQICKCFRSGERGSLHLSEFTMLEWYRTSADYTDLMAECESLILYVARMLGFEDRLYYQGTEINLSGPWEWLSVAEAFCRYTGVSVEGALQEGTFEELMVEKIEPRLGKRRPACLHTFPAALASLSRLCPLNKNWAERFELYLGALELANGFSELNDEEEQRSRFLAEIERQRQLGKPPPPLPDKFLKSLRHLPRSAGIALGLDRLAMVLADKPVIDEVVSFSPEEL